MFKGSVVGGQKHLIVETSAGEIGFYVFSGIADWIAAITSLVPGQPAVTLPALVLVHGGGHAADCWDLTVDEIRRIAPELSVLAVDLPGAVRSRATYGRSPSRIA